MVNNNTTMIGGLVIFFIVLVVGIALLSSTADTTSEMTDLHTFSNNSLTALNGTAVSYVAQTVHNSTGLTAVRDSAGTALTATTNYTTTGNTITMTATYASNVDVNETWYVDYGWAYNVYIDDGSARTMTGLIVLFFALAILLGSLAFIDWRSFGFGK